MFIASQKKNDIIILWYCLLALNVSFNFLQLHKISIRSACLHSSGLSTIINALLYLEKVLFFIEYKYMT